LKWMATYQTAVLSSYILRQPDYSLTTHLWYICLTLAASQLSLSVYYSFTLKALFSTIAASSAYLAEHFCGHLTTFVSKP
jgi:hypothetical protein